MKLQIIACDRCGKREDKVKIESWSARKGQHRYVGDLCKNCWDELLSVYQPSNMPRGRHRVQETDLRDIPS